MNFLFYNKSYESFGAVIRQKNKYEIIYNLVFKYIFTNYQKKTQILILNYIIIDCLPLYLIRELTPTNLLVKESVQRKHGDNYVLKILTNKLISQINKFKF